MATNGKYREGLSERLGWVPARLREGDPRQTIWVHAVSVGEVLAASRLVNELSACAPQYRVLLSTTTRTGQRLARDRTGQPHVLLPSGFSLDRAPLPAAVGPRAGGAGGDGVLAQPAGCVPPRCDSRGRRQWTGFRSLPAALSAAALLWKRILAGVSIVLAQSEEDAKRLKAIGAPAGRVFFGGNLKFDVRSAEPAAITTCCARS
jgi:3-deoxy-D-manno-octulosonic-acid transferase